MQLVHASAIASFRSSISSTENRMRLPTAAAAKRATATHSARAGMRSSTLPKACSSSSGICISHQCLHSALLVVEYPEDLHETRDVEDLLDLRVRADKVDRSTVLAHVFEATDQHA